MNGHISTGLQQGKTDGFDGYDIMSMGIEYFDGFSACLITRQIRIAGEKNEEL